MTNKFISLILAFSFIVCLFTACSNKTSNESAETTSTDSLSNTSAKSDTDNPVATITLDDGRSITVELYYDKAPNTVKNFIYLANKGFYDGLIFHRIIANFMIQGGDPDGTGTGGPGYTIKGEFTNNGVNNDLKNKPGYIAMARSSDMDSAGSQFYINVSNNTHLDGDYAVFGYVIDGMDIVYELSNVATDSNDKPIENIIMKSVTVDTKGLTYEEPETLAE